MWCAELTAEGGAGRICFMRVNLMEKFLTVGLTLLQHFARGTQPLVVSNWGMWQHREDVYKGSLKQLLLLVSLLCIRPAMRAFMEGLVYELAYAAHCSTGGTSLSTPQGLLTAVHLRFGDLALKFSPPGAFDKPSLASAMDL